MTENIIIFEFFIEKLCERRVKHFVEGTAGGGGLFPTSCFLLTAWVKTGHNGIWTMGKKNSFTEKERHARLVCPGLG